MCVAEIFFLGDTKRGVFSTYFRRAFLSGSKVFAIQSDPGEILDQLNQTAGAAAKWLY